MESPSSPRASDALFAAIARRMGRATDAQVAECAAEQARAAGDGTTFSLGQVLIRRHLLKADEFIEVARRLDARLFACPACGTAHSARALDLVSICAGCGGDMDVGAIAAALPEEALNLGESDAAPATLTSLFAGTDATRGRTFGKYEILKVVGQGGMGVVYKARQLDLDRTVALKILREGEGASEDQVRRFLAEAQAAAKLQHPNIVTIHEVGVEEGVHYFTMDFVEGETLHDKFQRGERFSAESAARLTATLARAVHYAHQRGIVHRDMKPGNVILPPGEGAAKITDFGLAKQAGADLFITKSGVAIGTPLYMSPEQARGDLRAIDGRSDIFSLGTILYQLLTGELPFMGQSHIEIYNKIATEDPAPPRRLAPAVPKDLQTICLKALEKRPQDRYASGKAFAEDLERALRGEPILARPPGAAERLVRRVKRHRTLVAVAATVALMGAAAYFATATIVERRQAQAEAIARARLAAEARTLLGEARAALAGGRARDAVERASLLLARYPDSEAAAEARFLEGEAELASGRVKEALRSYARAYRRADGDEARVRALAALADAFAAGRDLEGAAGCLRKIVEGFPTLAEARRASLRLGGILAATGDWDHARRLLAAAKDGESLAPAEREDARATLAWLDALGQPVDLEGADAAAIGDTDGDGRQKLLLLRGGTLFAYAGGPRGLRELYRAEVCSPREEVMDFVAADVDGDARAEAILAVVDAELGPCLKVVSVGRAPPGGPREDLSSDLEPAADADRPAVTVLARVQLSGRVARNGLAAGDVDGDGRAEIVICPVASSTGPKLFRLAPGGGLAAVDIAPDLVGRAAALTAWVGGAGADGRAQVILGTAGPLGDDVRTYRWNVASGALELAFRQKVGVVTAVLAEDLDRDGALDIVLAKTRGAGGARAEHYGFGDGLHVLGGRDGGGFAPSFKDALAPESEAGRRIASLAAGDLTATGAACVAALVDEGGARRVAVYGGFGREGGPWRREILLGERAADWVRIADLDADGDAELVVGGLDFVRIYGLRRKQ